MTVKHKANYMLLYFWIWGFTNIEVLFCKFFRVHLGTGIIKFSCTWCVSKNLREVNIWNKICWTRDEESPWDTFRSLVYNPQNGHWLTEADGGSLAAVPVKWLRDATGKCQQREIIGAGGAGGCTFWEIERKTGVGRHCKTNPKVLKT